MTVKTVSKKTDSPPKPGEPQTSSPGAKPPATASPSKKAAPQEAKVATGAAGPTPHHATLTAPFTETVCTECTVGLLKKYINPSLRQQRALDPSNLKYHLKDDEEIEFIRDKPLTLQLIGLRRERSLSNKFDDLLVVLYDPALLQQPEPAPEPGEAKEAGKKKEKNTLLDGTGLRQANLASTQAFVDHVLADKQDPPLKDWPLPGTDVSCLQCKHWRVLVFPITTEPGYDPKAPNKKDEQGKELPNFDDLTLLPDEIGSVAPGIYNGHYRVGLHKGVRRPNTSFAALQLVPDSIPARRRYPLGLYLKSAKAAFDKKKDDELRAELVRKDAKGQKDARSTIEEELKELPRGTPAEKKTFEQKVKERLAAHNVEAYAPQVLELRKTAARKALLALKSRINSSERYIRVEDAKGAETQNFEKDGNKVKSMEVVDDSTSAIQVSVQLVLEPPPSPPAESTPAGASSPPASPPVAPPLEPPAPPPYVLTEKDILVTFGTAAGTNIHRSVNKESESWSAKREVNNWSEGCQVFRSPKDYKDFMRLAMLSKRAHCPARTARCGEPLTVKDVEDGIGKYMTAYLETLPDDFADDAQTALDSVFPINPKEQNVGEESTPAPKIGDKKTDTSTTKDSTPGPTGSGTQQPTVDAAAAERALKTQQHREVLMRLFTQSAAHQDFKPRLQKIYRTAFPEAKYYTEDNYLGIERYAQEAVIGTMQEKSTEEEIQKLVDEVVEDIDTKMTNLKKDWLQAMCAREINTRYKEFLADGLEPCDFGNCGFHFDYMLAEVPRSGMEEFVSKAGARDWNSLFPQDAPPPAPKPAVSADPKTKPPKK